VSIDNDWISLNEVSFSVFYDGDHTYTGKGWQKGSYKQLILYSQFRKFKLGKQSLVESDNARFPSKNLDIQENSEYLHLQNRTSQL
jgi:hypothetical protein